MNNETYNAKYKNGNYYFEIEIDAEFYKIESQDSEIYVIRDNNEKFFYIVDDVGTERSFLPEITKHFLGISTNSLVTVEYDALTTIPQFSFVSGQTMGFKEYKKRKQATITDIHINPTRLLYEITAV